MKSRKKIERGNIGICVISLFCFLGNRSRPRMTCFLFGSVVFRMTDKVNHELCDSCDVLTCKHSFILIDNGNDGALKIMVNPIINGCL